MITCCLRYVIDPYKAAEFEDYARRWLPLVTRHGGEHLGYFLPHEGANNIALALFSFQSLARCTSSIAARLVKTPTWWLPTRLPARLGASSAMSARSSGRCTSAVENRGVIRGACGVPRGHFSAPASLRIPSRMSAGISGANPSTMPVRLGGVA